jgi:hypothetical protein
MNEEYDPKPPVPVESPKPSEQLSETSAVKA